MIGGKAAGRRTLISRRTGTFWYWRPSRSHAPIASGYLTCFSSRSRARAALDSASPSLKGSASTAQATSGPPKVSMAALQVNGERCRCGSAAREATNFLEEAPSQETSDVAETSDHEILARTSIASLCVVFDSGTEGRSGRPRSLQ